MGNPVKITKCPARRSQSMDQFWTLRHCHAKNRFVCRWHLISLSQPVQWFSADSGHSQKVGSWADLGRFREGKVDEPTPNMEVWRENLWCFSRWIPQSYYVNLMKSDAILFVPVLFGITIPNWPLCFLRWIRETSTHSTWCLWDTMGFPSTHLGQDTSDPHFGDLPMIQLPAVAGEDSPSWWCLVVHKSWINLDYRPTNRSFSLSTHIMFIFPQVQHGQAKLSSDARRMLILRLWGWNGWVHDHWIPRCNPGGWHKTWSWLNWVSLKKMFPIQHGDFMGTRGVIRYNGITMSNHVYQSNPLEWRKIYWWMAGWWNNWIIAYMIDSKWPTHTPQMMDETIMVMENDVAEAWNIVWDQRINLRYLPYWSGNFFNDGWLVGRANN